MKKLMTTLACGVFCAAIAYGQAAQDPQLQANAANAAVQDKLSEPDGVAIAIKPDGTFQIFARGSADYQFNNPKVKQTAARNATMRAKAALAKFLKEKVSSAEGLDDVSKTSLAMSSDGETQSQSASMESVQIATESIRNEAEAILTGVITLRQQNVPSGKIGGEIQVTVGISSKTLKAAQKLANGIQDSLDGRNGGSGSSNAGGSGSAPSNVGETLISNTDF